MISKSRRGSMFQWCFFTIILSLLQLWILLGFRYFRNEPFGLWRVLLDGVLIFYANTVAIDVLARRWEEFKVVTRDRVARDRDDMEYTRDGMFIYFITLPLFTCLAAAVMYCALLSKNPPSPRVVWGELLLTVIALIASGAHVVEISKR